MDLRVIANPRQRGRGRELARRPPRHPAVLHVAHRRFPVPGLTLARRRTAAARRPQPGLPGRARRPGAGRRTLRWTDDPGALPFPEFFVAHELAHQWWGQAVGLEELPRAVAERGLRAVLRGALRRARPRAGRRSTRSSGACRAGRVDESDQGPVFLGYRIGHVKGDSRLFRAVVYNKGAMVLHMLRRPRRRRGVLRAGCGGSTQTWRFKKAGTDDFRRAMEAGDAAATSTRFFEQWILGDGVPAGHVLLAVEQRDGRRRRGAPRTGRRRSYRRAA